MVHKRCLRRAEFVLYGRNKKGTRKVRKFDYARCSRAPAARLLMQGATSCGSNCEPTATEPNQHTQLHAVATHCTYQSFIKAAQHATRMVGSYDHVVLRSCRGHRGQQCTSAAGGSGSTCGVTTQPTTRRPSPSRARTRESGRPYTPAARRVRRLRPVGGRHRQRGPKHAHTVGGNRWRNRRPDHCRHRHRARAGCLSPVQRSIAGHDHWGRLAHR